MSFVIGKVVFRSPFVTRHPGDDIDIRQAENKVITTLRSTVEAQRRTIVGLDNKIADLSTQNEEYRKSKYRKSKVITPQEQEMFKNQSQLIIRLQDERNLLALWLRKNKAVEIAQGKHDGKDLIPLILQYLGGALPDDAAPLLPTPTPDPGKVQ